MGVGAGLSMYVVVVQKFTFAISSPDEFLFDLLTDDWAESARIPPWVYAQLSQPADCGDRE